MIRLLLALLLLSPAARAANPDALWNIVHDKCLPNMQANHAPKPCLAVDLAAGWVWLKDLVGPAQILTMPTAKITGMEDPAILAPSAPNWFAPAWRAQSEVSARLGHTLARDNLSLAINSVSGRTQNQLHIHTDCVNQALRAELRAMEPEIGPAWSPLPKPLAGHPYRALRLAAADLDAINPIRLLDPADDIAHHTLAAIGATNQDGTPAIILLDDHAAGLDRGSAEELQDHTCHGS
jgi:CDP-diacylglycerol pyrophosphatase